MEGAQDINLCGVCNKMCIDPRILPCFHCFCLRCLLNLIKGKKKPEAQFFCPVCDKEYIIPKEGLRRNLFIERQIKLDKESSPDRTLCCICYEQHRESPISLATKYCIECEKEMCSSCNAEHISQKSNKTHRVFGLGTQDNEESESERNNENNCMEHPKKPVEIYCKRCKAIVCMMCFAETHKYHDCIDLEKYGDQLRKQIEKNHEEATRCLKGCLTMRDQMDVIKREFIESAKVAQTDIDRRCEELKQMIEKRAMALQEELKEAKKRRLKHISKDRETLDNLIANLETFKVYCSELASKGSHVEISRDVDGITDRRNELQKLQEIQTEQKPSSMKISIKTPEFDINGLQDADNIVGSIEITCSDDVEYDEEQRLSLYADVWGVTKLDDRICVLCRSMVHNLINVYSDRHPFGLIKEIKLKKILLPVDMVSDDTDDCLYVSDRAEKCVWKIPSDSRETKWLVRISWPFTLSVTGDRNLVILRSSQPSSLELYGPEGCLLDKFQLPAICQLPRHAVETPDGDFVILHKYKDTQGSGKMVWGVSKVTRFGQIVSRFLPQNQQQMLRKPCHLALRHDNQVFVADPGRDGVVQLDSHLSWNTMSLARPTTRLQWPPRRLFYDVEKNALLVGQEFGGVYLHNFDHI